MNKGFTGIYILIILLIVGGLGGAYFFSKSSNKLVIPQINPTITQQPIKNNTNPASTDVGETANWKTYTNNKFSFKYPPTWFIEHETSNQTYIRIQNYEPLKIGGGYDPIEDKGRYSLQFREFEQKSKTTDELKEALIISDKEDEKALGKRFISNTKELKVNEIAVFYREVALTNITNPKSPDIYILDGKGDVIQVNPGLDIESGKKILDQILATFKFLN